MEETLTVPVMSNAGWSAAEFDDIVREHQARIYRVLWCELRDDEAAATLTQDCFLKAYRARAEFRGEASVSTWLVRIAVNLARDYQRNRRQGFWQRMLSGNAREAELATETAVDNTPARRSRPARPRAIAADHGSGQNAFPAAANRLPSALPRRAFDRGDRSSHGRRDRNREVASVARGQRTKAAKEQTMNPS